MNGTASNATLPRIVIALLVIFAVMAGWLVAMESEDYPDLHTILDTGITLLAGGLALLLWDTGKHSVSPLPKWLAVSFVVTGLLWLAHALVTVEWSGPLAAINDAEIRFRPLTSPPPTHLLPIGMGWALWRMRRGRVGVWGYAVAIALLGATLFAAFLWMPPYSPPGLLGVTRPTYLLAPLLWALVGLAAWRLRGSNSILRPIAWMAAPLFLGNIAMLYSRFPGDGPAIAAHFGTITGYLVLFLSVTQQAAQELRERIFAEATLSRLNEDLDRRVLERTAELAAANETLEQEMSVRRLAEEKAHAQLERLFLLHQITRAIGERQDLDSIFQVAVRSVESQLPADFACLYLYDDVDRTLTVGAVGLNS